MKPDKKPVLLTKLIVNHTADKLVKLGLSLSHNIVLKLLCVFRLPAAEDLLCRYGVANIKTVFHFSSFSFLKAVF